MNELTKKITCTQQFGRTDLTEGHGVAGQAPWFESGLSNHFCVSLVAGVCLIFISLFSLSLEGSITSKS